MSDLINKKATPVKEPVIYGGKYRQIDLINSGPEADVFLVENVNEKKKLVDE